jgi:hypothetical protein
MGINTDARTQSSILIGFEKKADSCCVPDNTSGDVSCARLTPVVLGPIREASGCHFERTERSFRIGS